MVVEVAVATFGSPELMGSEDDVWAVELLADAEVEVAMDAGIDEATVLDVKLLDILEEPMVNDATLLDVGFDVGELESAADESPLLVADTDANALRLTIRRCSKHPECCPRHRFCHR